MSGLTVSTSSLGGEARVVDVRGELDLYTSPQLERELADAFEEGAASVIVDLSRCELLDSSTLAMLLRTQLQLGSLSLVIDDGGILKPFQITGFDQFFAIFPTREEAAHDLAKGLSTQIRAAARQVD